MEVEFFTAAELEFLTVEEQEFLTAAEDVSPKIEMNNNREQETSL